MSSEKYIGLKSQCTPQAPFIFNTVKSENKIWEAVSLIWHRLLMDKDARTYTHRHINTHCERWRSKENGEFVISEWPLLLTLPGRSHCIECSAQGNRICTVQEKLYLYKNEGRPEVEFPLPLKPERDLLTMSPHPHTPTPTLYTNAH